MLKIFVSLSLLVLTLTAHAGLPVAIVGAFQCEVYDYSRAVKVNLGTINTRDYIWINEFFLGVKKDGIYSNLDLVLFFCGSNIQSATVAWMRATGAGAVPNEPAAGGKFADSDYTTSGLKGNGVAYLIVDRAPEVDTSVHVGIYVTDHGEEENEVDFGAMEDGAGVFNLYAGYLDGNVYFDSYGVNEGSGRIKATTLSPTGFFFGVRRSEEDASLYFHDQAGGFQELGTSGGYEGARPNMDSYLFAANFHGADSFHSTKRIAFFTQGKGMSAALAQSYSGRIQTFQSRKGRAQ